jgi:tetratricopeptide (TPR) repeat protein
MPRSADVHRLLGLNYYALEQYRLFELQMRKAKELRPDAGEFDYWLGRYYQVVSEDCAKAIPFFTRAISLDLENHRALYNRGDCYERSSEVAAAEKDYVAAIKLIHRSGARDSWPFQALANLFLRINRSGEALALAREAISLEPDVSANHLILGKVLALMEDVPHAIQEFQAAVRLSPTGAAARYQLYRLYVKAGDRLAAQRERTAYQEIISTYLASPDIR